MEIGWTDVGSGGYILVSFAHSNTSFYYEKGGIPLMKMSEPASVLQLNYKNNKDVINDKAILQNKLFSRIWS